MDNWEESIKDINDSNEEYRKNREDRKEAIETSKEKKRARVKQLKVRAGIIAIIGVVGFTLYNGKEIIGKIRDWDNANFRAKKEAEEKEVIEIKGKTPSEIVNGSYEQEVDRYYNQIDEEESTLDEIGKAK